MNHPKFGTKFSCYVCASKFYDMRKPDPKCPKCGADPREDPALKAAEKGSRKEAKDDYVDDSEAESFEADMDELAHDDEGEVEEEGEPDELTGMDD